MRASSIAETIDAPARLPDRPIRVPSETCTDVPERCWTINGDFLGLPENGISRFAREVTAALDLLIAERHPLTHGLTVGIVAPKQPRTPLTLGRIALKILPELRPRLPQVWVQFQLPRAVKGGLLSFCNLAPIRVDRQIVCIHDLQTKLVPESYGFLFRLLHQTMLPHIGRRADVTTTVSEYSRMNLIRFGIARPETIAVVHNGSDHALRWQASEAARSWRTDRPFVLCIGRNEAHKNMQLVWRLAHRLDRLGVDIVVAGDLDPLRLDASTHGRPPNIRCLGRVSDADLARGFAEALCFLFPSRTEGFGLPAVEAMSHGCPVIASSSPCLPEICGSAALFADPDDESAWIEAVESLLNKPHVGRQLGQAGRSRSERFTWRSAATRYLELMMTVDRNRAIARQRG